MKKIMFAAALATAMTGFSDVTSANIVGYNTDNTAARRYIAIGPTFVNTGNAEGKFTLGQTMKVGDGYTYSGDKFYLVNPGSCEADRIIIFRNGLWYDTMNREDVSNLELDIGTGFQSEFGNTFDVTAAGQVHLDGYTVDNKLNDGIKRYQFIVNGTGRAIKWKELTVGGDYSYSGDKFYVVNPSSCEADKIVIFRNGIWYDTMNRQDVSEEEIPAGEGFQTEFSNNVTITFPPTIPAED